MKLRSSTTVKMIGMHFSLKHTNTFLFGAVVVINLYIITAPLAPKFTYWWATHRGHVQATLQKGIHTPSASSNQTSTTEQVNSLVVPSMLLNTPLLEAPVKDTYAVLDKGIWRWPLGSTPDKGSNTVLIGHRFTYTNPKGIFYYMDKVHVGDEIGVTWNNLQYLYKVSTISEVNPSDTSITTPTSDARITMYTCTPLWNPLHRLVVVAEEESQP